MGDNGFREFAKATFLPTFGNPNASASGPCQYVTCMHRPGEAGCASPSAAPSCLHQWLRPDNGVIECATCGATCKHYGE